MDSNEPDEWLNQNGGIPYMTLYVVATEYRKLDEAGFQSSSYHYNLNNKTQDQARILLLENWVLESAYLIPDNEPFRYPVQECETYKIHKRGYITATHAECWYNGLGTSLIVFYSPMPDVDGYCIEDGPELLTLKELQ